MWGHANGLSMWQIWSSNSKRIMRDTRFLQHHGLYVTTQPSSCRYAWRAPGGGHRNQIDYILIKKRCMKCVTNVRAYPGPDCGSDHNMVSAIIKLRIN